MHKRTLITTVVIGALVVSLWPAAVHANLFTDAAASVLSSLLDLVVDVLNVIRGLLVEFIAVLGTLLNTVIGQPELSYGGAAVYTIWKIFRDVCNMFFIVLFIFVSFGTIFNSLNWSWLKGWYFSSALKNIIIAAIAINFSLAIGQTIVWGGNFATGLASSMVSGKNVGAQIATALQITNVTIGQQGAPISTIPDQVTPLDQQNPVQRIATSTFTGNAKIAFDNCLKFNQQPTVEACGAVAARIQAQANAAAIDYEISRLSQSPSLSSRLKDALGFWKNVGRGAVTGAKTGPISAVPGGGAIIGAAIGAWNGATIGPQPVEPAKLTTSQSAQKVLSLLLNIFLLLVIVISYGTVVIFMVIRFPMIWLLLSFSSIAFFVLAIPNSKLFTTWFKNLVGWCIFSPLYLLVIYLGLFLLSQQNTLLAGMKNAAFLSGSLGIIMFYVMTAIIFVYGARLAFQTSFKLAGESGLAGWVGKIGGGVGISEKGDFGLGAVSSALGISARYEGAKAGVSALYKEKVTAPLARREQDVTARYQARFGDRRAGEALEQKRIKEQFDKNKEAGLSVSDLKSDFSNSRNVGTPKYFAAAKALLEAGELDPTQMSAYVAAASRVSPSFGQAVKEAAEKKIKEKTKEKKFKDADDVNKTLAFYEDKAGSDATTLEKNKKARDSIMKSLEENQPLIAAEMAKNLPYFNPDGSKASGSDILERNSKGLDNAAWAKIIEKSGKGELTMTPRLKTLLLERTKKAGDYLALAGRLKSKNDQIEFAHMAAEEQDKLIEKAKNSKQGKKRTPKP